MGNIMSFFFPQPAPASIEQVEEAAQEGGTTEEAAEETVAAVAEDAVSVETTQTGELVVDKEIEATEVLPEGENDDGFEVVEENSLIEVNNLHQETNSEVHPEIISSKEKSPGPDGVEETQEESQTETECIGSIEDNNVNLLREEAPTVKTPEPVKAPTPEPQRAIIPEPVKAPTPEAPIAITPEPVKAPTPEPLRSITPDPVKVATPEPPRTITPEPVKAATPEPPRAITPDPVKASSPEPPTVEPKVTIPEVAKAPTPEPEQASSKVSSDVEVIEFSAEDDNKMSEEVSGGASGLRDILDPPTPEPQTAITPEPVKAPTPEAPRALTPEPVKAPTPEPPTAEPVPTPEPPKVTIPEVAESPTSKPEEASPKDISSDVEVIEFSAEDDKKMAEEVSGGASGLRDILDEK